MKRAKEAVKKGFVIPSKISDESIARFGTILLCYGMLFLSFSPLILLFMDPPYSISYILMKSLAGFLWLFLELRRKVITSFKDTLKAITGEAEETMILMYFKQLASSRGFLYGFLCCFYIFYLLLDMLVSATSGDISRKLPFFLKSLAK